jgi:hypothetical protein
VLKGISPMFTTFGMPRTLNKLNVVKVFAIITKNETAIVPAHPKP